VRCDKCQAEAVEPALFCEQCGRDLTAQETHSLAASENPDQYTFDFSEASSGRCGSCGGPSSDGDLCAVCLEAFSSVLRTSAPRSVEAAAVSAVDSPTASEAKLYPVPELVALCDTPAAVNESPAVDFDVPAAEVPAALMATLNTLAEASVPESPASVAASQAVAETRVAVAEAADAVAKTPAAVTETAAAVAETPVAVAESSHAINEAPAAVIEMPVAAAKVPVTPAQAPPRNRAEVVAAAAVLIIAAVGVPTGARWLQNQAAQRARGQQTVEQPMPAPAKPAAVAQAVVPPPPVQAEPQPAAVEVAVKPAATPVAPAARPAPAAAVAARPPAAANTRQPRAAAKPKTPAAPVQPAATAVAAAPAPPTPAPEPAPAPPQPAVTAQLAPAPEAPSGKLFDPSDVDETPRISGRVAPQLPGNLPRTANDVVVVRILVSQSGHAFRVNLLRKSRLGPAADEAVVAAVKQWTFSPARKRGEAVSCWFNVGVSLAGN